MNPGTVPFTREKKKKLVTEVKRDFLFSFHNSVSSP